MVTARLGRNQPSRCTLRGDAHLRIGRPTAVTSVRLSSANSERLIQQSGEVIEPELRNQNLSFFCLHPCVSSHPCAQCVTDFQINNAGRTRMGTRTRMTAFSDLPGSPDEPSANSDSVEVVIADTSCGIPAEHLPHIFDRFYRADPARTSPDGSGLGLLMSLAIWVAPVANSGNAEKSHGAWSMLRSGRSRPNWPNR